MILFDTLFNTLFHTVVHTIYFDISFAFLLDLLLGDPVYRFHPIRLIGNTIFFLEPRFRNISKNQIWNGFLFALFIITGWYLLVFGLLEGAGELDRKIGFPVVQKIISIFFIYSCISVKDLKDKAIEIKNSLSTDSIDVTRQKLSMIVGRETQRLNKGEIVRATVETVAENIVDGILSPLFFAFIGGAPAMVLYKAVNTLDSMVGYKNEKYIEFGRAGARFDDVCNFIPARLSALFIPLASLLILKNGGRSIVTAFRDGQKHSSPNSGISEAAVAGALGVRFGGVNFYHGKKSVKPYIGNPIHHLAPHHIRDAVTIAYVTGSLFLLTGIGTGLYFL
jgi:adenosylcobinamide-phosphate synthase